MNKRVHFHEQLRLERKRRGWSQEKVAQLLDIDPKTVGRWERNETFPTLQLHSELSRIFGKSVEELGLFSEENSTSLESGLPLSSEQEPEVSQVPHTQLPEKRLFPPFMRTIQHQVTVPSPSQNAHIEERIQVVLRNNAIVDHTQLFGVDSFIEKVKDDLFAPQAGWVISLFGEGGLGKTALAYEIVARYAAAAGFTRVGWVSAKTLQLLPDGALLRYGSAELQWIDLIKKLANQLDIGLGDNSSGWISDFQHGIRSLPSEERCLLVVDNLETMDDVNEAIQYLGSNFIVKPHKLLVTTRQALLGKVPYLIERHVEGLELEPALSFIRSIGNSDIAQASEEELKPIVEVTEGNPLLIKLFINRFLTSHLPLALVLAELQAVNRRLGKNVIDYLYAESLAALEQQCGKDAAHWILNAFCPLGAGDSVNYEALHSYSGIEDEETFQNTLRIACDLSLIRTSKLNSLYSIHSLLWKFVCDS